MVLLVLIGPIYEAPPFYLFTSIAVTRWFYVFYSVFQRFYLFALHFLCVHSSGSTPLGAAALFPQPPQTPMFVFLHQQKFQTRGRPHCAASACFPTALVCVCRYTHAHVQFRTSLSRPSLGDLTQTYFLFWSYGDVVRMKEEKVHEYKLKMEICLATCFFFSLAKTLN